MIMSSDPAAREPDENQDQPALRRWITAGLQIPEVRDLHGDAGYLLSNMIAKYTLAASRYQLSKAALHWFQATNVDLSKAYARSKFYGKGSALMYEHSIPSSIIRSILLNLDPEDSTVKSILERAGVVVVVLRSEDDALRRNGLARTMPAGWRFGDSPYARYEVAEIELSGWFLQVKGKIQR